MQELARQVRALIVTSGRYQHAFAGRHGIGLSDAAALGHLFHNGSQSPRQIAAGLNLTPAAVTALVDRLEAAGYVSRSPHPSDRRQSVISLNPAGAELMQHAFDAFAADVDQAVIDAPPTHLRELSALIERIAAALDAQSTPPFRPTSRAGRDS